MMEYGQLTGIGGRKVNEDFTEAKTFPGGICVALADGLGSYGGGEIASRLAVQHFLQVYKPGMLYGDGVGEICQDIHRQICQQQTLSCEMKSTLVVLMAEGEHVRWMHIGDSRLYHFTEEGLAERTLDHSVPQMAVAMGEITEKEIRCHVDRNKVLRALGSRDGARPELSSIKTLGKGFHAFLLCTDGFWEYVLEEEMELDLCRSQSPVQWLKFMEERLKKKVIGENDNYTAAAVFLELPE